ncbi:hypothetical protein F8M41_000521 [Gigaspora margarita]|uniref:F-box domain-containing protein n=1 Tax=Gigaspora margarita TaxID=4874 RepID=A0A8H3XHU6_GIGMA|nr:hypothetical protein F8M41_000521 [Gigaspora margarita]
MSSINQEKKKDDIKFKSGTIDQIFAPEYFNIIFRYLTTNRDLYSCILVNRYWANCAIPILWESPFKINNVYNLFPKVIQVYQAFSNSSIINKPLYDYPSFLKELPFDRFLNSAITNDCSETLIFALIRILSNRSVKLRRFDLSQLHLSYNHLLTHKVLPQLLNHSSLFKRLSYLNCTYHLDVKAAQQDRKDQIFNALANNCHNIINIKATVWSKDEAIALANLICSQKWLKKFSLVNSNESASFSVQSLQSQAGSLNKLTFKNMHLEILSNIIKMNGKTIETIIFDWHSRNPPECTQLIKNISECTINLEHLKTPLYTLEQLALILQTQNHLKNLDIFIGNGINPYCALYLFINMPFNNLKNSIIQLYFDG